MVLTCNKCGKDFRRTKDFERHSTMKRPCNFASQHKCLVCGTCYASKGSLRQHEKSCGIPSVGVPRRPTIQDAHQIAKLRNGECLSTTYEGDKVPLLWRCADGHEWPATLSSVNKLNSWCGRCAGVTKLSIRDAQDTAAAKGGECLSEEYANANADLLWRCRHGHEWRACLNSVKNKDSWCLLCAGQIVTLQDAEVVAAERGGRCLSDEYKDNKTALLWECEFGHTWKATYHNVSSNASWCPECPYKNERECREIFEELLGRLMPKRRPKWLKGLELDGLNEDLRLGFEYNGIQHYEFTPAFHHDGEALVRQQERDIAKEIACDDQWITLIIIPHTCEDKRAFIHDELYLLRVSRR